MDTEQRQSDMGKKLALKAGVVLYLFGVIDMSANVLVSGWLGWTSVPID